MTKATELLGVDAELAGAVLRSWWRRRAWSPSRSPPMWGRTPGGHGQGAIWLVPFHRAEVALAGGCSRLLGAPSDRLVLVAGGGLTVALDWLGRSMGVTLAPEQAAAVQLALTERVAVLTGGPGCGKSHSVRAIVALARAKRAKVVLAAPTGRAAKRLSELAGLEAATCTGCCSCAQAATPPLTATIPWTPTWWWWMRPRCWMLLANKLVKAVPPGRICCWSATSTSSPASGPGGPARPARRRYPAPGAADQGVPPSPAKPGGDQRPPHQRRPAADHPGPG